MLLLLTLILPHTFVHIFLQTVTRSLLPPLTYSLLSSPLPNRHTFLEMCQYRHYQFDTLRRAKHSSLMLLYHLHFPNAVNTRPLCSLCNGCMRDVRWHCDTCIDYDICDSCYHEGVEEREGSTVAGEGEVDEDDDNNSRTTANHATGTTGNEILLLYAMACQHVLTKLLLNTSSQHILSIHPINPLSTHPLNVP